MLMSDLVEKYGTGETITAKISSSLSDIFDFTFPMYDETYRTVLETKIVKRYYSRELNELDEELWKLRIDAKLNEIMPLYNQRYATTLYQINPLYNHSLNTTRSGNSSQSVEETDDTTLSKQRLVDITRDDTQVVSRGNTSQSEGSNTQTATNSGTSRDEITEDNVIKKSDTPMGSIQSITDGYMSEAQVEDKDHTTVHSENGTQTSSQSQNATVIETSQENANGASTENTTESGSDTTAREREQSVTNTEQYLESVVGNVGVSQSKLVQEYRDILINIDVEILNELKPLFNMVF